MTTTHTYERNGWEWGWNDYWISETAELIGNHLYLTLVGISINSSTHTGIVSRVGRVLVVRSTIISPTLTLRRLERLGNAGTVIDPSNPDDPDDPDDPES